MSAQTPECADARLRRQLTPRAHTLVRGRDLDFGGWVSSPLRWASFLNFLEGNRTTRSSLTRNAMQRSTRATLAPRISLPLPAHLSTLPKQASMCVAFLCRQPRCKRACKLVGERCGTSIHRAYAHSSVCALGRVRTRACAPSMRYF